jgi:hypothetical protein
MATPAEKLAESLAELKNLQDKGIIAIKSDTLTRTHRERLQENNFIEEVHKGWYIAVPPHSAKGDSTPWYSNFWEFCAQYLDDRFGSEWSLYPEQSLQLHAGNTTVPQQLMVRSPHANNQTTTLPHGTSLFLLKTNLATPKELIVHNRLRIYTLAASLVRSTPTTFTQNAIDVRTALSLVRDASEILELLLEGGHSVIAGRLTGAFRNIGQERIANNIIGTMQKAGYDVREIDPFETKLSIPLTGRIRSPYENRIKLMWADMRSKVLPYFPAAPGLPADAGSYLKAVEEVYVTDAYHSLSIEKYTVTPELIERVRTGTWDLKGNEKDRQQRDAMAAKGYYEAFKAVGNSIDRILHGDNAGTVADEDHEIWYRELFGPSVTAGILKAADLAGYRNHQVYIGGSMHTPLNREAVRDAMPVLFELLTEEQEAAVRATLGHFIFVFIHPYMDGNGRMGRFLMNAMLASGGYPWTVIPVEQRDRYMQALESASVRGDIEPFAKFLGYLVGEGMKGTPVAKV